MSNLKNDNGCYDMKDLQEVLPVGKNELYELVHSKGFPQIKVGRRILISKKLFEEWSNNASAK